MNVNETVNIVVSSDDNYAQHLGVMVHSLLSNTRAPDRIHLFLIDGGITEKNLANITAVVNRHNAAISIVAANAGDYAALPLARYGLAAYQRISMADILPSDLTKVIYLDADTLVFGDIIALWNSPMDGKALAAVENLSPKVHQHAGFSRQGYFNSGVLLTDLSYWRAHNVKDKVIGFIQDKGEQIKCFDQCGLNHAFENNWRKLSLTWNQQGDIFGVLKKYADGCGYSQQALQQAIATPNIVHFIGTQKPWLWRSYSPYKRHYLHYLSQTPWQGSPFQDDSLLSRLSYYCSLKKRIRQIRRQKLTLSLPA